MCAMTRTRSAVANCPAPEDLLLKATRAKTAALRARYARQGLELAPAPDNTTRLLLQRQLYLAAMERRRFVEAREVSESMVEQSVLVDVAHQDAARACLGCEDLEGAIRHLRLASRLGPPSRRAFHLSMLGALLYLNERAELAVSTLTLAVRWSTTDRAICRAQLALAKRAAGYVDGANFQAIRSALEHSNHHRGYGEYLLGELCTILGDYDAARAYFRSFVERTTGGRVALAVALTSEIGRARRFLDET